ncbi:hypothetical protein HaLaN_11801, partial [Haematococcus lacustris]
MQLMTPLVNHMAAGVASAVASNLRQVQARRPRPSPEAVADSAASLVQRLIGDMMRSVATSVATHATALERGLNSIDDDAPPEQIMRQVMGL